jgi:hypothetical protein
VNLWLAPDGYLEVRVHTDWRVEETDEQRSLDDLGFARCVVDDMIGRSPDLAALISDRPWRVVRINFPNATHP